MRRRYALATGTAIVVVSVTGCTTAPEVPAPSARDSEVTAIGLPVAHYLGALPHDEDFPTVGISLAPPGSATAIVDVATAYAMCRTTLACPHVATGPTISLAQVSTQLGATVTSPDSPTQVPLAPVNALAFVFRWTVDGCRPVGGVPGNTTTPGSSTCLWMALVNATTGQPIGSADTHASGG